MNPTDFEELAYRQTPLGELVLRRRAELRLGGRIVYEVKLGDAFLMSSLFTVGETALADLALESLQKESIDVAVGGLGLGYTTAAALRHPSVRSLVVIEALGEVIEWHRTGLVPLGPTLCEDVRCRLVCGDFFALAGDPESGLDYSVPGRRFDAVLLDIDHSPQQLLSGQHAAFYSTDGLRRLATHLRPEGIFAMWSNDPPDAEFQATLDAVFPCAEARVVEFDNPYLDGKSACTVYLGQTCA